MERPVGEFMSLDPVCVSADSLIKDAENLMRENKVRALVVISARDGERETICGILELFSGGE